MKSTKEIKEIIISMIRHIDDKEVLIKIFTVVKNLIS